MFFGTSKRLNLFHDRQVNCSVNGSLVNTTTCYKYLGMHLDPTLNFETHFHKIYKKAAGRVNLLRRIRFSVDTFSAQQIYQSMIMPIFTYCGYKSLGWSESRKREIIAPKCSPKNCHLRFLTIDIVFQKKTCCFVFDCLIWTACFPFRNYFQRFHHSSVSTLETIGGLTLDPKLDLKCTRVQVYLKSTWSALNVLVKKAFPLKLKWALLAGTNPSRGKTLPYMCLISTKTRAVELYRTIYCKAWFSLLLTTVFLNSVAAGCRFHGSNRSRGNFLWCSKSCPCQYFELVVSSKFLFKIVSIG